MSGTTTKFANRRITRCAPPETPPVPAWCATAACWRCVARRTLRDDAAAAVAALRAQVDDPVGFGDHVEIVLDDDHRVAGIDQPVQHADQLFDVGHVQADGRLVEHVERVLLAPAARPGAAARALPRTFASSVTSLMRCASPPESVGLCWPEREVAQAHVLQQAQSVMDRRDARRRTPTASSTLIASTSPMLLPLQRARRASRR